MAEINIKKIQKLSIKDKDKNKIPVGKTGALVDYEDIENDGRDLTAADLTQSQTTIAAKVNELIDGYEETFENIKDDSKKLHLKADAFLGFLDSVPQTRPDGNPLLPKDWYVDTKENVMKMYLGNTIWQNVGAKSSLTGYTSIDTFGRSAPAWNIGVLTQEDKTWEPTKSFAAGTILIRTDKKYVPLGNNKDAVNIFETQEAITKQIEALKGDLANASKDTNLNLFALKYALDIMNGTPFTSGVDPKAYKEKQDKLRDDQFIETATVDFMEVSAISSAAGIAANLVGIKKDITNLQNKDANIEGTLNTVQQKVDQLATNPTITAIEKKADDNAKAIAGLATNPTVKGISDKATANDAAIKALQTKEQGDVTKLTNDLTAAQSAIDTKILGKADKKVVNAIEARVTTNEGEIRGIKSKASTQESTVTTHSTKIGALETKTTSHDGTLQQHGAMLTVHGEGIKDNTDDIKDLKSLVSFMGIYTPASLPVSGGDVKAKFGAAKLGMFAFVKASADGDLYQIWTAEANPIGGVPTATGDWIHEVGADITINMKPYLEMEMVTDGSRQKGPTGKGEVIYGDQTDPTNNKWVKLTQVLKDAYETSLVAANKGKLMTIVNTGTDAAPVWDIAFEAPALQGTDLLMEATGGWSAGYTPQIGDVVVVNEIDAAGKIVKLGATVKKAMFGDSEEKTPGSGIWTAKTDTKDRIALGGDNSTELVYIDNPTTAEFTATTGRRVFAFDEGDTKGAWKILEKPEINGKKNFVTTDAGKLLAIKAIDAVTGNVELEPIDIELSDFTDVKGKADSNEGRLDDAELRIDEAETDIAQLKKDKDTLDGQVTELETFKGQFDGAADGGYVFKKDDDNYETKTLKDVAAALVLDTNFGTTDAEKETKLVTEKEVKDAIKGSLELRQKELINFQQQKTLADGTLVFEADGVTPVMVDLSDSKKPVKYTGEKDTALEQAVKVATKAAQGKVVLAKKNSAGKNEELFVSDMTGEDVTKDPVTGVETKTNNDDKKLVSKKYVDDKTASSNVETIIKNVGKVSDYMPAISKAEAENRFVRFWHHAPGSKKWTDSINAASIIRSMSISSTGQYIVAGSGNRNIYVSNDYGKTWKIGFTGGWDVYVVAVSADGKHMIAGIRDKKIIISNDFGATWAEASVSPTSIVRTAALSADGKYMIFGSNDFNVYVSDNYGATWRSANRVIGIVDTVAISSDGQYMAAGREFPDSKIYVSKDKGITWAAKHTASGNVRSIKMSADGKYMVAGSMDKNIYVSNDHGDTWTTAQTSHIAIESVDISADGKYMAGSTADGVIYVSSDFGVTWTKTKTTATGTVKTVAMSADGKNMIAPSHDKKIYTSNDYGQTWTEAKTASGMMDAAAISADGRCMVAGAYDGQIYVSKSDDKHHHSLVYEITREDKRVYSSENGKTVEIGNLQLGGTYHLEIEVTKGTTIADGTSTDGDANPTVVTDTNIGTSTIIKNVGKVSDYMPEIAKAESENKLVRFWHEAPGKKSFTNFGTHTSSTDFTAISGDGKYIVFTGNSSGDKKIHYSSDYGKTFSETTAFTTAPSHIGISNNGKYVLAGTSGKMLVSDNYGATYTEKAINTGSGTSGTPFLSNDGKNMVMPLMASRIIVSKDYGATFSGMNITPLATDTDTRPGSKWATDARCSDDLTKIVVRTYSGNIWYSIDSGVNWTKHPTITTCLYMGITEDGQNVYVFDNVDKKLHYSNDGMTNWKTSAKIDMNIRHLTCSKKSQVVALSYIDGTEKGIWISEDGGNTLVKKPSTVDDKIEISDDGNIIIGTQNWPRHIRASVDKGSTWIKVGEATQAVMTLSISDDAQYFIIGEQRDTYGIGNFKVGPHHHALVHEVDKEELKVYSSEEGKTVEIGNVQLGGNYHLEIEVEKGATIADGTSTDGDTSPTVITPDAPSTNALAGYKFKFSDGVVKNVLIQEVAAGTPAGPGIFTFEFNDGTLQKVKIMETV